MSSVKQTRPSIPLAGRSCLVLIAALCAAATALRAQELDVPPNELVRLTVANEVAAANHPDVHHMFRSRRQTPKGSRTRIYVETNQALAGMLIAVNDQPVNAQQQQAENDHLAWLVNNPDQLHKKAAREKEDEDRSLSIVKALPVAFTYEYAGTENSVPGLGAADDPLVKLKFRPNPSYIPPTHVEQVLKGMEGVLLIDSKTKRLARIDGTLFQEVTFGWGILGHLDKGGHFVVQQGDLGLGDGAWGVTRMSLNFSGKILMFKGISIMSDEVLNDFHRLPDKLTFAEGVQILKTEEEKLAHNNHAGSSNEARNHPSN
ncbi:MAG TPA: hypothetical protein VH350_07730 [Candidatus Sulfotelmatobacter sp.]|nr:hypothetical protein [Candidatus Sulfotelmatobacter sp.]